ncbi:MAG TPA: hypothetical protein VFE60_06785 [Roseiarcus sp.]|nr:hypothetical protein [Roseiarcus sp.]
MSWDNSASIYGDGCAELDAKGERLVWLEPPVIDRLTAMRQTGESYSDVILRLIEISQAPAII